MAPDLIARVVDGALEAAVVPSFTRIGPAVRRRTASWADPAPGSLADEVVVVTGATSGIGAAIARALGGAGATVVVVGRDPDRGRAEAAAVDALGGSGVFLACDLAERAQVRALAAQLEGRFEHIRALVHNAGALVHERREASDGLEITWASMVVGPHLLTRLLADRVDRAIWMSSGGMYLQALDLADWSWASRPWDGTRAYAQAKRAQVDLVAEATARREGPLQVAMHPGWAATPGVTDALPAFDRVLGPLLRSPAEGADTAVWLVAAPAQELAPGAFYLDRRPRGTVRWPGTATSTADRARLRALVDEQAGLDGAASVSDPRATMSP